MEFAADLLICRIRFEANYCAFRILHREGLLQSCCQSHSHALVEEHNSRKPFRLRQAGYREQFLAEVDDVRSR